MPKVKGPLFSLSATGTLSRMLTYETRTDGARVRRAQQSTGAESPMQGAHRSRVGLMADAWAAKTPAAQQQWKTRAITYNLTGYALYWREWFFQNIQPPNEPILP